MSDRLLQSFLAISFSRLPSTTRFQPDTFLCVSDVYPNAVLHCGVALTIQFQSIGWWGATVPSSCSAMSYLRATFQRISTLDPN
jgi:hypothetical protein